MSLQKLDGRSADITVEQTEKLQQLFPEAFTEDKVDFDTLKAALGEEIDLGERYGLSWKGKSNVFRAIQQPTTKTLKPVREESVNFDETDNLFIEGDNLEVLKTLQRAYYGKIKMIYIDPPYNTGNDFVYNDKFAQTQAAYTQEAGLKDENGNITRTDGLRKNSKDGGHFHSNWLNMMYPRLYLARNLLRQDGVIFVSIDDNEVHNLRMIMNEIFGEENFVAQIIWKKKYSPQNDATYFSEMHDYILCYARQKKQTKTEDSGLTLKLLARSEAQDKAYINPDNDERGPWKATDPTSNKTRSQRPNLYFPVTNPFTKEEIYPPEQRVWRFTKDEYERRREENRIWWGNKGQNKMPSLKSFLNEVLAGRVPQTIWDYSEVGHTQEAKQEVLRLFKNVPVFDTPKPVRLMTRLLQLSCSDQDIAMDFFSGSGSLAQAVQELNSEDDGNRKWVCVQLPEAVEKGSEARKAGYENIADIAKERIRRAGKKIQDEQAGKLKLEDGKLDLGFKVFKLDNSNFKVWNTNIVEPEALKKQSQLHLNPIKDDTSEEDLLFEIMIKVGIEPTAKREKMGEYWNINNSELIICLAKSISPELFQQMLNQQPQKVIILDKSLTTDQSKTNLTLQAAKSNIEILVV